MAAKSGPGRSVSVGVGVGRGRRSKGNIVLQCLQRDIVNRKKTC